MLVDAHVLTAGYVGFSHRDVRIDGDLRTKLLLFSGYFRANGCLFADFLKKWQRTANILRQNGRVAFFYVLLSTATHNYQRLTDTPPLSLDRSTIHPSEYGEVEFDGKTL